jgi:NAD(P)-dependent dehydrogenase (short-subunit alcohol dehydrogenase family)
LLDRGFRVFGSVRKQADADRLKSEFGANFTPLIFDVTDEAAVLAAAREVRGALNGETLAGLVNNAGIAVSGPVLELAPTNSAARWRSISSGRSSRPRLSGRCSAPIRP